MLDYLFTAHYKDGTSLLQTQEDVSSSDSSRSAFFDVDHSRLREFELFHFVTGKRYSVNLEDGSFSVTSTGGERISFRLHEYPVSDLRLIFFRRHTHNFNVQNEELAHQVVYRLGWQGNDHDGKNIQHVIEFD